MADLTDAITEVHETTPLLPKPRLQSSPSSSSLSSTSTASPLPPPAWRPFLTLAAALTNCLWAGSVLIFSLYAPLFNEKLGYRQMHTNAVSVATELGMYLPVPVFGYICDRFGPAKLSLLSTAFFGPGYALAAAAYSGRWDYRVMMAAFALVGMGTSSMYFAGVTTCAKNFTGGRRGLALALPIAAFGLSSLWQAQVMSRAFMGEDGVLQVERMFLFFAVSLVVVGLLGGVGLRVETEEEEEEEGVNVKEDGEEVVAVAGEWVNAETRAFLRDRSMWWFAGGVFLVTGPGEAFINNMGTLIQTLRPSPTTSTAVVDPTLQVSLIALTSTLARLLAGSVSDYLAPPPALHLPRKWISCSRMNILFFFAAIMFSGFFLVASGTVHRHPEMFWLVSSSIGAGYGAVFCLAPTIVSVVWGTRNFGTHWGIVTMTPALGAVVYGCLFAAEFDAGAGEEGTCVGFGCVAGSFAAMAGSVMAAVVGWTLLWGRWRRGGVVV